MRNSIAPALACLCLAISAAAADAPGFSIEQILSAPFAAGIVVAADGPDVAWVSNAAGRRGVWLATAMPGKTEFSPRPVTRYSADDGLDNGGGEISGREARAVKTRACVVKPEAPAVN